MWCRGDRMALFFGWKNYLKKKNGGNRMALWIELESNQKYNIHSLGKTNNILINLEKHKQQIPKY